MPRTRRTSFRALLLVAGLVLAGCTTDPGSAEVQPTEPPPAPLSAPSAGASGTATPTGPVPTSETTVSPSAKYVFPVRTNAARFGRVHHDYPATDIFAPCGTAAVAVTAGVVSEVSRTDDWTAAENDGATRGGLSVSIVGADGVRYYGSHLKSVAAEIVPGHPVEAGDVLGHVGHTGSARPTACHLHFGISPPPCAQADWWNRRGVLSPYPFLTSWQDGGHRSPVQAVTKWRSIHGCPTKPSRAARG